MHRHEVEAAGPAHAHDGSRALARRARTCPARPRRSSSARATTPTTPRSCQPTADLALRSPTLSHERCPMLPRQQRRASRGTLSTCAGCVRRSGLAGARIGPALVRRNPGLARRPRAGGRLPRRHGAPATTWDEYLATLDKKARHEIRRKMRRAEAVGELSIEILSPTSEVDRRVHPPAQPALRRARALPRHRGWRTQPSLRSPSGRAGAQRARRRPASRGERAVAGRDWFSAIARI